MKLLLAVSGGIDSMYMAEQFLRANGAEGIAVAHCNFLLRGAESDGDEDFVREWCRRNGVEYHRISFDTSKYAAEKGISLEMAARDLRYVWFAQLCREQGFSGVAVAHNADDNAETMMLNLLRGTGGRGMRGMAAVGTVPGAPDVPLYRPLLGITRKEISSWMEECGVEFREDSTNSQSIFKRNKVRNKIFPIFREINPSFVKTFSRNMANFAQEDAIAEDYFQENKDKVYRDGKIDVRSLLSLKHWEYVLYRLTEPYGFNMQNLNAVIRSLKESRTSSGKVFIGDGYQMISSSESLIIEEIKDKEETAGIVVEAEGEYCFNNCSISVRVFDRTPEMSLKQPRGTLIFDADSVTFPFVLRGWRKGDWLNPLGLAGRKKLSNLFVDLKFSLADKVGAVVLEVPGLPQRHVGALLGYRIDDSLKVTDTTVRILMIRTNNQ